MITRGLKMAPSKVGVTLNESPNHLSKGHPESPERFRSIESELREYLPESIIWLDPQPIQPDELESVHPQSYVQMIMQQSLSGGGYLDYGDTYVTGSSYADALDAAACTLSTLEVVLEGEVDTGFAIVRPPGHHASNDRAMGFCLFNNIALAARTAQSSGKQRVGIVDFDVHHGNGTQDIFYSDPDVLYISTHQWGIFPGTGAREEIGPADARGSTVNIPLPPGVGDSGMSEIYNRLIDPVLHRFKPEILLVSAGFDAHMHDPLASLQLSAHGYYELTRSLVSTAQVLCDGRLMLVLEGGYNPDALARCVLAACHALTGQPLPTLPPEETKITEPDISALVSDLLELHSIHPQ